MSERATLRQGRSGNDRVPRGHRTWFLSVPVISLWSIGCARPRPGDTGDFPVFRGNVRRFRVLWWKVGQRAPPPLPALLTWLRPHRYGVRRKLLLVSPVLTRPIALIQICIRYRVCSAQINTVHKKVTYNSVSSTRANTGGEVSNSITSIYVYIRNWATF